MDVHSGNDQVSWDSRLTAYTYPPFTQLWSWGEAQIALGKRVLRQAIETAHGPILAQWVEERRGPFTYWFCPQGPVIPEGLSSSEQEAALDAVTAQLSGGERIIFYRIEPRIRSTVAILDKAHVAPLRAKRVRSLNPSTSLVVSLEGGLEQIQERMHKKTRYNIRLAERHAVIVRGGTDSDKATFFRLMKETEERDGFLGHDQKYLETICSTLCQWGNGRFRLAESLGKPLAVNFEVLCGDTVMYLYGASSSEDREKMASYALQWSGIFAAAQEGYKWYDFGGGNPEQETDMDYRVSWEGITRFKERWGAMRAQELGTFDIVRSPLLYKIFVRR